MQEKELSVIIPVYNAEKTIERCLTSVLNGSITSLEVICVNDGSEDRSQELLEKWKMQDSRLILLNQENKGVSAARNAALRIATGRYTVFVDADDEVTPNYFQHLLQAAHNSDAELVICGFSYRQPITGQLLPKAPEPMCITPLSPESVAKLPAGVCSHLYKTTILRTDGESAGFPTGIRYGEDTAFHYSLYPHIHTIVISDETGYIIYQSEGSATSRASELVGDMVDALLWLHSQYRESTDLSTAKYYLTQFAAHTMRRIHALSPFGELKKHTNRLREAMKACEFSEDDLHTLEAKYAGRLLNIMRGGRGITPSYYFKALKAFLRKRK